MFNIFCKISHDFYNKLKLCICFNIKYYLNPISWLTQYFCFLECFECTLVRRYPGILCFVTPLMDHKALECS